MGLEGSVSLAVAALDLQLVRLLRDAIRTADIHSAVAAGGCGGRASAFSIEPRRHIRPEPIVEPRVHLHPEPRFDTGPVLSPDEMLANCCECTTYSTPAYVPLSKNPIEPPWKVLPWDLPVAPPVKIKIILHRPDIAPKGVFINVFA